jgi:alpha-tubulin suppressor-like RCC1 family protein
MIRFAVKPLVSIVSVATLVSLGTVVGVQQNATTPAAAAAASVGVFSWGTDSVGELGNGSVNDTLNDQPAPVLLPTGVTPTAIAGGNGIVPPLVDPVSAGPAGFAIGSDGNVYAWGSTSGPAGISHVPVVISLPGGVTPEALSAGQSDAFVIGSDGHLYAWGGNALGVLGNGTTTNSNTPVQVSLPAGVTPTSIAAGLETAYAIGSDGHLYAWGDNVYGELGDGGVGPQTCTFVVSVPCSTTPVQVPFPAGVTPTAISAGGGFALAIGSDGHIYAWGGNNVGQLGDGSVGPQTCSIATIFSAPCSTTPVQVSLPAGVTATAVSGGGGSAYAIGSDGHLYAWGYNGYGGLGNGTTSNSTTPVQVSLPAGVTATAISGSGESAYAIGSDGNLYAWGDNVFGELGDGTNVRETTPVEVVLPPGSSVQKLGPEPDAETGYAIVRAVDVAPTVTTQPSSQTIQEGTAITFTAAASAFPGATVQWQVSTDGGSTWSDVAGAKTVTLNETTSLSQSGDEYRAVFTNSLGSATSNSATLTVTLPPPPTTSVLLPSNGATVSSDIWLDAVASSGVGVTSVSFEVSGGPGSITDKVVSPSSSWIYGYLGAWDTTDVPNGTYTLQSVATDALGQSTTSAGITVTVDNLPLQTAVLVPSGGATLTGTAAVLDASATGTSDVTSVQFEVSNASVNGQVVGTASPSLYGWYVRWNTTAVANGTYTLQSVATEVGGTTATSLGVTVAVQN